MPFNDLLADLDASIDEHLRDPAILRAVAGSPDVPIRVLIEYPAEAERFDGASIVRTRPWVEISVRLAPTLAKGDVILMGEVAPFEGWRIAEAPKRPGDGRHWRAEVEALGVVTE